MEHESYVSLEIAKMLKQLGFDWKVNHYYFMQNGKTEVKSDFKHPARNYNEPMATMDSKSFEFEVCSRPTHAVAQRWLREVKELNVEIGTWPGALWRWVVWKINPERRIVASKHQNYKSYEEAIEEGIKNCLIVLLEKP